MRTTVSLLLSCGAALAIAAPTNAKAPTHHAARKQATHRPDTRDAQIKALEAKVDALTQRLDQSEAAQQATAKQAQRAQDAAAAAQTQASNAISQTQAEQAMDD